MATQTLKELMEKTESLSIEENLELIAHLIGKIRKDQSGPGHRRKWSEICGAAPYPLAGEDAQNWVTRTRHESNDHRGRQRE